jgi:hypothetical protein
MRKQQTNKSEHTGELQTRQIGLMRPSVTGEKRTCGFVLEWRMVSRMSRLVLLRHKLASAHGATEGREMLAIINLGL